jgi:transposase
VQVPGGSSLAQAIRYGLNHWDGLVRFLDDGRIEIDSNTVERAMRPIALTRKNALFAGSDDGAENWAMLASLIQTCKLQGLNPEAYFTDVLTKLVNNWPCDQRSEFSAPSAVPSHRRHRARARQADPRHRGSSA